MQRIRHMQIGVEASRSIENKRVFVVDSDEVTRAALQFMLHDENETHEISSVPEAIVKRDSRKVDLILLGYRTLKNEGSDVLHDITEQLPDAKIILVASSADEAQECAKLQIAGVLVKPLTVESVRLKVNAVLGRSPGFNPFKVL